MFMGNYEFGRGPDKKQRKRRGIGIRVTPTVGGRDAKFVGPKRGKVTTKGDIAKQGLKLAGGAAAIGAAGLGAIKNRKNIAGLARKGGTMATGAAKKGVAVAKTTGSKVQNSYQKGAKQKFQTQSGASRAVGGARQVASDTARAGTGAARKAGSAVKTGATRVKEFPTTLGNARKIMKNQATANARAAEQAAQAKKNRSARRRRR